MQEEEKSNCSTERITTANFAYGDLSKKFREYLQRLQDDCASVRIVFDGSYEPKQHRRRDPERESSVRFSRSRSRLRPLLHDQLMSVVRELKIEVRIAPGEADPVIVRMAREHHAYIVAQDTDYFLYENTYGYVPLNTVVFSTLQGISYSMQDVFEGMTQQGVALWATTIIYDFIKFDVLKENFPMENAHDAKHFRLWLESTRSDTEKCERLTCQYTLLRYIQQVGDAEAFDKIIDLVPAEQIEIFRQLLENYINIPSSTLKLTRNGNKIHPHVNKMYNDGKFDPVVIDILVRRQILSRWSGDHPVHFRLLSRMCSILIQWDQSTSNNTTHSPEVTFNGKSYDPREFVPCNDLPSLDQLTNLDRTAAERLVLGCVNFALESEEQSHWTDSHRDYTLSFCLLKLWAHRKTEHSKSFQPILMALIIAFLKHSLLDIDGGTEERSSSTETSLEEPYRQRSPGSLKSSFSREQRTDLRQSIRGYATFAKSTKEIEDEFEECQQVYKELSMVNQFFQQPFDMPPPGLYFNQLTYRLAVRLSQLKNVRKDETEKIFSGNQLLTDFSQELYEFFVASVPSSAQQKK